MDPQKIKIHQFHSGSGISDAVTNAMIFTQSLLECLGFESAIFAEHVHPGLTGKIRRLDELRLAQRDILLMHHSMGHDAFQRLADLRCRKFLVYHNITPPEFFSETDPTRAYALKGYAQLSMFRDMVESAIAVSPFNAQQLNKRGFGNVAVIPLLKDFTAIRFAPHRPDAYHDPAAVVRLLFVGRIVPHKCQHELIEFVRQVRSLRGVPLELVLVGDFADQQGYKAYLDHLISTSGLDQNVKITGRVSDDELFGWYRASSAYVSLSEHEGFGVPLVEAMAFELPVIAFNSSAVPDTLGGAGIAIPDKEPKSILEPLLRLVEDRSFRGKLVRAQRQRLLRFSRNHIHIELQNWLAQIGVLEIGGSNVEESTEQARPSGRKYFVIEGPFETSYSLAVVNRNLALALARREGCDSSIAPIEGVPDYSVDETAANRLLAEIQDLVRQSPVTVDRIITIRNTYPPRPNGMLGDIRLLHLAWEESAIAQSLVQLINLHLNGVLVPSEYTKRVVRDSGVRLPIAVIGHGVDHSGHVPHVFGDRQKRGEVSHSLPFTFLHVSSGLARKGIEELVTAYCIAFSIIDPVLLVIKTFDNPQNTVGHWVERLAGGSEDAPAIQVISEELDQLQMDFLYHTADALVLPSRGEGFNLPAAEGMARGVPAIVSRNGGHLDFCSEENSFLVNCSYVFSESHLSIPNSYWARPSIEQLVRTMKAIYRAGRSQESITAQKGARAQGDASCLRWGEVASRVEGFVEYLHKRPVMTRKLRLGWVSTYNARCGIAAHSEHLLEHFDKNTYEITILADDQEAIAPDPNYVLRLWRKNAGGLPRVADYLIRNKFDAVLLQHNFSFFDLGDFADALIEMAGAGINTYVIFHRTRGLEANSEFASSQKIRKALRGCTRLFVHSLDDVNRLCKMGITDNVVLLTHGVIDRPPLHKDAARGLLGLSGFGPVIGTFGFLLPGKGLPELIHAFALLLRAHPRAYLLMLNADYPTPESDAERERCQVLIRELDLENHVALVHDFLDTKEILLLLSACDAVVYPYQDSEESASGAVRLGLASGRPVLTTPLPNFSDLSEIVYRLPGTEARAIAEGIIACLKDEKGRTQLLKRQRDWIGINSWAAQAARISNIIEASFEESHRVELRPPRELGAVLARTALGSEPGLGSTLDQEIVAAQTFLERRAIKWQVRAPAADNPIKEKSHATIMPELGHLRPEPSASKSDPQQGFDSLPLRLERSDTASVELEGTASDFISLADKARDSRDWPAAARYYQRALERQSEDPAIWVQYGHALKESGKRAEAEGAYRKSLSLAPVIADTHLQLGHVLKIQGKKNEASDAYLRALALDPQLEDAAFELRALGWSDGRIELALRDERSRSR